jgi:hypothetical protein
VSGTVPLVSVFLDGLRPDWVAKMPFVRSIADATPLRTEFGYSIACHASMYTGLSIQDHGYWFVWLQDPAKSRFKPWLQRVPRVVDAIPTRLVLRKLLLRGVPAAEYPRGFFYVPRLVHVPIRQWPGMWVSEEKFWDEDDYAPTPTFFELARKAGVSSKFLGFHRGDHLGSVEQPLTGDDLQHDWYYLFMGEIDHAAHVTGGEGHHFDEVLARVDAAIAARCKDIEQARGGFDFVLWSDHGHQKVQKQVDIYKRIDTDLMRSTPHVVDTNFARFWTSEPGQRDRLLSQLEKQVPEGRVLQQEEMQRWECWFPDHRYGDVVFYLDAPSVFSRTAWGYSRSQNSIHGYIPDLESMSGTLVTSGPGAGTRSLREMFAVHTARLGL